MTVAASTCLAKISGGYDIIYTQKVRNFLGTDCTTILYQSRVVFSPHTPQELYHSRCSCLVGVADVYRNMTGEFPQTLSMAGCYYACQLLEPNYFMVSRGITEFFYLKHRQIRLNPLDTMGLLK